jgi:hypothetical protein
MFAGAVPIGVKKIPKTTANLAAFSTDGIGLSIYFFKFMIIYKLLTERPYLPHSFYRISMLHIEKMTPEQQINKTRIPLPRTKNHALKYKTSQKELLQMPILAALLRFFQLARA